MENQENQKKDYLLSASIIIAALLIGGSWIYSTGLKNTKPVGNQAAEVGSTVTNPNDININPVNADDHILGNPNAPVKIIEFTDLECPFCKIFHETTLQIMNDYNKDGKVAWIYRNYPLESLHPVSGRRAAEASECAAELGGNEKFWAYIDTYFKTTPSNDQINPALIPQIGEEIGLNRSQFESCIDSGKFNQKIDNNLKDGTNAGLKGTPYSVVIGRDGKKYPIGGAQSYDQVKLIIEQALQ